jgi:hypothetical protein
LALVASSRIGDPPGENNAGGSAMIETRREEIFTGVTIAFLLLASALDARFTIAAAVALLIVGVLFLRNRARRLLAAVGAAATAVVVVAVVRMLS